MIIDPSSLFEHRTKIDGTVVSFCRECRANVAASQWEADLDEAERNHTCHPIEPERFEDVRKTCRIRVKRDNGGKLDFPEYRAG